MKSIVHVLLFGFLFTGSFAIATNNQCVNDWGRVNPIVPGNDMNDIVWISELNKFIAVGDSIYSSVDGITWKTLSMQVNKILQEVVWNGQQLVAVGNDGLIMNSLDGVNWQQHTSGVSENFVGVEWNGNYFFVIGTDGVLLKSEDGFLWQNALANRPSRFTDILWTGERWVLTGVEECGSNNRCGIILTSEDGRSWGKKLIGTQQNPLSMYTTGSEFFINVIGSQSDFPFKKSIESSIFYYMRSSDGLNWTIEQDSSGAPIVEDIVRAENQFFGIANGRVHSSSNGVNWIPLNYPPAAFRAIAKNSLGLVALGNFGSIATSIDGLNWERQLLDRRSETLTDIHYRNGQYIAVGQDGAFLTSSNGETWNQQSLGPYFFNAISANENIMVIVGQTNVYDSAVTSQGVILTSTDGLSWDLVDVAEVTEPINNVSWIGEKFVAVSSRKILSSQDGNTWNAYSIPDSDDSPSISYTNPIIWDGQQFLILTNTSNSFYSEHGSVYYASNDGITWDLKYSNHDHYASIAYNGGFLLVS